MHTRFALLALVLVGCRPAAESAKSASLKDVDREIGRLTDGAASLSTPAVLDAGRTGTVRLTIAATPAQLDSPPAGAVALASRMSAVLTAPDLEVHPLSPELQAVSATSPTEWSWQIRGSRAGPASLHLTLSAALTLDGAETPRVVRSFDRTVEVRVSLVQRVGGFLAEQWQWVLATLGAPLAGGVWRWRRRARGGKSGG